MSHTATQKNRNLQSNLGDQLLLIEVNGYERISELFSYRLKFISAHAGLQPKDYIGSPMHFSMRLLDEKKEQICHGMIAGFTASALKLEGYYVYEVKVVPWLWFLKKRSNYQIFQNKTIKEIITKIFKDAGFKDYQYKLQGEYPTLLYCTQYGETDFHFISRLMEEHGIFYYFAHTQDKHTLILSDHTNGYAKSMEDELIHQDLGRQCLSVHDWNHHYNFQSGKWTCNSHDFQESDKALIVSKASNLPLKNLSHYERYEELPFYQQKTNGEKIGQMHIEAEAAQYSVVEGSSNYYTLRAGETISLNTRYFPGETHQQHVIIELQFHMFDDTYLRQNLADNGSIYTNTFQCIPNNICIRPKCRHIKPIACGPQEAMITGASGQTVYTNKWGCYKIKFYWDRSNKADENSSCWVRAVQHWEGLLRVDTPVLVDFMQGDVDRPIIIGPVQSDVRPPLYSLPTNKMRSGIKRRWPKQEEKEEYKQYNEIYFEDKPNKEMLGINAGKDMQLLIQNDRTTKIQSNDTTTIQKNRMVTLEEGDDTLEINKGDLVITVKDKNYTLQVNKGNVIIDAKSDITMKAGGNINLTAGKSVHIKAGSDLHLEATQATMLKSGTAMDIKAGTSLTQQANASLKIKANANCALEGGMTSVKGNGMTQIEGALVKIN